MRSVATLCALALIGCEDAPASLCRGDKLFGRPTASTGLDDSRCGPRCDCRGAFVAPEYTSADADALLAAVQLDPPSVPASDPYAEPAPPETPRAVCAIVPVSTTPRGYRTETFASAEAATQARALVTHTGACGLCSSLADLAVYLRYPDLTTPVRQCGLDFLAGPAEGHVACLEALGFTPPCATIWYFNTVHTRAACALPCLSLLDAPYQNADGSLNECLQCDEDESGPVFKAVAGRTRRNTGVASALCRPCAEVQPILHDYASVLREGG